MTDEGAVCTYYLQFLRRIGILSLIRPRYRSATFPQGKALLGRCAPSHKLQFICAASLPGKRNRVTTSDRVRAHWLSALPTNYNLSYQSLLKNTSKNCQSLQSVPEFSTFSAVTFLLPGHIKRADKKEG